MSIALPAALPAFDVLRSECLPVVALDQPRPRRALRIALLNLMPDKPVTETQHARLLAAGGHDVELTLLLPKNYRSKSTSAAHLDAFYRRWSEVRGEAFDGLIVTGAPLETLDFEKVDYWDELTEIFDWARGRVRRSFYICWAAQAALYHYHGVPKHVRERKCFGVFKHRVAKRSAKLLECVADDFWIPVSRHTEVRQSDLAGARGLEILVEGAETGPCLLEDRARGAHYMFNHLEYDADTLKREYLRDIAAERPVELPKNYFPEGNLDRAPVNFWRQAACALYSNWLDEIERDRDVSETLARRRAKGLVSAAA
ncbi:MAG: homoserine O-succinyltransferase [Pseudomonadota bacterium]